MSGFKYKGTLLNDMIGAVSTFASGPTLQYICDANSTSNFTQYFDPLTANLSGAVSATSNARLANPTLYTIPGYDIADLVIASYTDCTTVGSVTIIPPAWATACNAFVIGAGGSGAGGCQGFHPQGQGKSAQQGKGGGGGGGGGIISTLNYPTTGLTGINVTIGNGGAAVGMDSDGFSGGDSKIAFDSSQYMTAYGGYPGMIGSGNNGPSGIGGSGGGSYSTIAVTQGHFGIDGQTGAAGNVFNYCNGGPINDQFYGQVLPLQVVSNGGSNQNQIQTGSQGIQFVSSQGYGSGGAGGASGNQQGGNIQTPTQGGSDSGAGASGFARIYWLNTA